MMRVLPSILLLLAGCFLLAAGARSARAEEQLVYAPIVTDGIEYRRVFYPSEAGTLLVLADTEAVLDARRAPVAYWPITREYLVDFSSASAPIGGAVEIVDASGKTTSVKPESYVQWHPDGVGAGPVEIVRGERAGTLYAEYLEKARASVQSEREYQRIAAEHRALVESWIKLAAERRGKDMPPPPPVLDMPAPEPYRAFATEPASAAIVSLPAGRYTIRIRGENGEIVPGSQRDLVSFAPLAHGIGYVVRPENRWTQPIFTFAPDEIVYTTGQTNLFFQPLPVVEYPGEDYSRLFNPQTLESADATIWAPRRGSEKSTDALAVRDGGALVRTLPPAGYRVLQTPGASRGYEIQEFAGASGGTLNADFTAMRLDAGIPVTQIGLVKADGAPVEDSARKIRVVKSPHMALVFLPALLPLLIGAAVAAATSRRRRRR